MDNEAKQVFLALRYKLKSNRDALREQAFIRGKYASTQVGDYLVCSAVVVDIGDAYDAWESPDVTAWFGSPARAGGYVDFCGWARLVCACENLNEILDLLLSKPESLHFMRDFRVFLVRKASTGFTPPNPKQP